MEKTNLNSLFQFYSEEYSGISCSEWYFGGGSNIWRTGNCLLYLVIEKDSPG